MVLKDLSLGWFTDYDKLGTNMLMMDTGKEVYKKLGTLEEFDKMIFQI